MSLAMQICLPSGRPRRQQNQLPAFCVFPQSIFSFQCEHPVFVSLPPAHPSWPRSVFLIFLYQRYKEHNFRVLKYLLFALGARGGGDAAPFQNWHHPGDQNHDPFAVGWRLELDSQ